MATNLCTCGCTEAHRIATRTTADGIFAVLWSDGMVTSALGLALRGVPMVRPRTAEAFQRALRAGWAFMGRVELFDASEIGGLYQQCRAAA